MALMDPVSNAMIAINNAELAAKRNCKLWPASKLLANILEVMKKYNYIEDYEIREEDGKRYAIVKLGGKINKCRAIRPRYSVKKDGYEKYEKRYLPSRDIGILIVSTSHGVMSHIEAMRKGVGGKLLAYVY